VDRRPATEVEHAELDARAVNHPGHDPAEGVNLADQLPLGQPADGRVTRHLGDGVEVEGQEEGSGAHARGDVGRLATGVAGTDHYHVEVVLAHR